MKKLFVLYFFVGLFVLGCGNAKVPAGKTTSSNISQPVKINGQLLAKVNDWAIGLDDFNNYLEILKTQNLNVDINTSEFKQELLTRIVNNQILAEVAVERGIDKEEDIQKALRNYKSTLLAEKITADLEKTTDASYAEVKDYYEKNKQSFVKAKEIQIREIVLNTEQEAKDAYIRILGGEDFGTLAQSLSAAPTGKSGGFLDGAKDGYITLDQNIIKNSKFMKFWETVVGLAKGEKSNIFKGDDKKFYIVKVDDIKGGQEAPLTEVQSELTAWLKTDKTSKEIKRLVDGYKSKARVEINQDLIK